ncbi:MAG: hypothetical protein WAX69_14355 [Victivallales bacterium]
MKGTDSHFNAISLCMPLVSLVSICLFKGLQGYIALDAVLPGRYLLMMMIAAACAGIISGITGLIKKEKMTWMAYTGMSLNACFGFVCFVLLLAS